jgi:DNA primase
MEKLLKQLKIDVLKTSGDNYICRCPFHKEGMEEHPSFGVNIKSGLFNCFACGARGNLVHLVMARLGLTMPEAIRFLEREQLNITIDTITTSEIPSWVNRYTKSEDITVLNDSMLELYKEDHPYLQERSITKETAAIWECGYDRWMNRVTFPVRDKRNRLLGIVGRSIDGQIPKYYFYDNFPKGGTLYGLNKFEEADNTVIVVEGIVDVLWLWQSGIKNVVAIMGSMITDKQAEIVRELGTRLFIWLDNDTAGSMGTGLMADKLYNRMRVYQMVWSNFSGFKDPHLMDESSIKKALETMQPTLIGGLK